MIATLGGCETLMTYTQWEMVHLLMKKPLQLSLKSNHVAGRLLHTQEGHQTISSPTQDAAFLPFKPQVGRNACIKYHSLQTILGTANTSIKTIKQLLTSQNYQ